VKIYTIYDVATKLSSYEMPVTEFLVLFSLHRWWETYRKSSNGGLAQNKAIRDIQEDI